MGDAADMLSGIHLQLRSGGSLSVCVVVPSFNEAENLSVVIPQIVQVLSGLGPDGRVIVVDDGSTDGTGAVLRDLEDRFPEVSHERLSRNRGKAAALQRGFELALNSQATSVVMMDADGQDDPVELPRLMAALGSGSGLATGARVDRHDRFIKRSTSKVFNRVTSSLSGAPGRDFNSGFKVMSADVAADVSPMLYGEMHRYLTVIAHWLGYRTYEVPVVHHERLHGKTKYGVSRFWRGFIDLLTMKFLMSYQNRPSHLFGGIGFVALLVGLSMLGYLFIDRLMGGAVGDRPMLIAGVLLVVVGLQLVLFGLLAELVVYTRQQSTRQSAR